MMPSDHDRSGASQSSSAKLVRNRSRSASAFPLRGWADLSREIALWAGFAVSYEIVRWTAAGKRDAAISNAETLIRAERHLHVFVEHYVQHAILDGPRLMLHLADWTYWLAQFAVVLAAFTWAYLSGYRLYPAFRNAFFLANTVGLIVYLTVPLAPPRLFPQDGLVDTLRRFERLNLHSGVIHGLANPYAAMPSLHAADALIVGAMLYTATRSPWLRVVSLAWPAWVCTALLATGNHFSLDIAAGLGIGAAAILAAGRVWPPSHSPVSTMSRAGSIHSAGRHTAQAVSLNHCVSARRLARRFFPLQAGSDRLGGQVGRRGCRQRP